MECIHFYKTAQWFQAMTSRDDVISRGVERYEVDAGLLDNRQDMRWVAKLVRTIPRTMFRNFVLKVKLMCHNVLRGWTTVKYF